MVCEHKNTRKLFWLDQNKGKWMTTDFSFCIDCKKIIKLIEAKHIKQKRKNIYGN